MEKVLWGTKNGFEEVLSTKEENFEKVKTLAAKDGFNCFRVAEYNNKAKPNFAKTINI